MMDFIKLYPSVTREQYMWEWSVPQIKLAMIDYSHTETMSEEGAKAYKERFATKKYDNPMDFVNDLNIPIIKMK